MQAFELRARLDAGLQLCGRDEYGYQWLGTFQQWQEVSRLEGKYEQI